MQAQRKETLVSRKQAEVVNQRHEQALKDSCGAREHIDNQINWMSRQTKSKISCMQTSSGKKKAP